MPFDARQLLQSDAERAKLASRRRRTRSLLVCSLTLACLGGVVYGFAGWYSSMVVAEAIEMAIVGTSLGMVLGSFIGLLAPEVNRRTVASLALFTLPFALPLGALLGALEGMYDFRSGKFPPRTSAEVMGNVLFGLISGFTMGTIFGGIIWYGVVTTKSD